MIFDVARKENLRLFLCFQAVAITSHYKRSVATLQTAIPYSSRMRRVLMQSRQWVYRRITDVPAVSLKHEGLSGRIEDAHEDTLASPDKTTRYRSGDIRNYYNDS